MKGPQEVTQSAETTPNKVKVISSNPTPPLVQTCIKKKKKKTDERTKPTSLCYGCIPRQHT
jgi:hypothetical protein